MKSRKDKEKTPGFFCRKVFMEQLVLLETPAQFLELFGAAYAYIDDEEFEIKDNMVKMAFSSWKIALNYDKEYHKERKANSIQANEAKKKKREAKGNILMNSPSDEESAEEPPLADTEEVEQYPFEDFYSVFPMHRDKTIAEKCWSKMPNEVRKVAFEGAKKYAAYIEYRKQYEKNVKVMYPSTYLHQKRWEDEYEIPTDTNNQSASNYGSNNGQQNGRTQQQINIERNAQAVAKLFSEIRPMQPDESDY